MLELNHLKLPRTHFTCNVNVSITPGERVVLMGKSGSGKTSLLSCIAGFDNPSQGQILWHNQDLTTLKPQHRPLTMLFQSHNLFPHLTVFQNVCLGLRPSLKLNAGEKEQVMDALITMGLQDLHTQRPGQLSGGEIQRTALARSLLRPTELLLLDEPFAALGPRMRQDLVEVLLEIQAQRSLTILMATHHPEDARKFGGRLLFIDKGHITLDSLLPKALESSQIEEYLAKN